MTPRVWKVDETNVFKAVLFVFLVQYAFGLAVFLLNRLVVATPDDGLVIHPSLIVGADGGGAQEEGSDEWLDGFLLGLNAAVFGILLMVLRLQDRQYEIDDAEEVLRVVNFLPVRWFAVSATYPLSQLRDVSQVVHKDDVCVRVAFEGLRGEDLHFVPEDQEDFVRALSVYLPEDHPNRGPEGVAWVLVDDCADSVCRPPWPCSLVMSKQTPIHSARAIEATWSQLKTWMGTALVWTLLQTCFFYIMKNVDVDASTCTNAWICNFVISTLTSVLAGVMWNMGNVHEYRIHKSKLQLASSGPFVGTEDHDLKYVQSVSLVNGSEITRLATEEHPPRLFVLGDLPSADSAARQVHVHIKRKTGLLDLAIMPEDAARFADVLAHQALHHQMMV